MVFSVLGASWDYLFRLIGLMKLSILNCEQSGLNQQGLTSDLQDFGFFGLAESNFGKGLNPTNLQKVVNFS